MLDPLPKECLSSHSERCTSVDVATLSTEKDANVFPILWHVVICWLFTLLICGELSTGLKFQGLWVVWLRAKYLWSDPTYVQGLHTFLLPIPAGTEQTHMAPALTAPWSSMDCGSPSPNRVCSTETAPGASFLLCFPFLIVLLLPWTRSSLQSTTLRNHSVCRCCAQNLAGHFVQQQLLRLCTGAVILLTCPSG